MRYFKYYLLNVKAYFAVDFKRLFDKPHWIHSLNIYSNEFVLKRIKILLMYDSRDIFNTHNENNIL